jgi:hypothetical protein
VVAEDDAVSTVVVGFFSYRLAHFDSSTFLRVCGRAKFAAAIGLGARSSSCSHHITTVVSKNDDGGGAADSRNGAIAVQVFINQCFLN